MTAALRKFFDRLYLGAAILAAVCLAGIAVLIFAQVIGRWFGFLVPAAEEFAGYLLAASTFLALAWTLRSGGHIRVNLVIRHFSGKARRWQEALVLGVVVVLAVTLAWSCIALVLESWRYGDVSTGYIAVPLWLPQAPMALGLVIFTVALLDELICLLFYGSSAYLEHDNANVMDAE